jgi:Uma2 family endonuclease
MISLTENVTEKIIIYPDSDGQPMADNTKQFNWIVLIKEGLEAWYAQNPEVFVAGDLLWYPVEGEPKIRAAPDVMVAFGRPKGDRGSYKQWLEAHIAPQVVFEILSPGNRTAEMLRKHNFYQRYEVEEYYVYDPDNNELLGWQRQNNALQEIINMQDWVSPRLQIRFVLDDNTLFIYRPDGKRFATYTEIIEQITLAEQQITLAEQQITLAEQQIAEEKAKVEAEKAKAEAEKAKADKLAQKLREMGINPDEI